MRIIYVCDCCEQVISSKHEPIYHPDESLTAANIEDIMNTDMHTVVVRVICDDCHDSLYLSGNSIGNIERYLN